MSLWIHLYQSFIINKGPSFLFFEYKDFAKIETTLNKKFFTMCYEFIENKFSIDYSLFSLNKMHSFFGKVFNRAHQIYYYTRIT